MELSIIVLQVYLFSISTITSSYCYNSSVNNDMQFKFEPNYDIVIASSFLNYILCIMNEILVKYIMVRVYFYIIKY